MENIMIQINFDRHLEKNVSLLEFILLCSGIFKADDFHKYNKHELNYSEKELYISTLDVTPSEEHRYKEPELYKLFCMREYFQLELSRQSSELPSNLNHLKKEQKIFFYNAILLLKDQAKNNRASFPKPIHQVRSQIDGIAKVYSFYMLCRWFYDNVNFSETYISQYVRDVFRQIDYEKKELAKETLDSKVIKDGYVKIDTLPKIIQLMIEVTNKPEYQISSYNYDESTAIVNLDNLAKKMNIYFKDNARTTKGLANINAQKVISFIQKDKD